MNAHSTQTQMSDTPRGRIEQRVRMAGESLRKRYGGELSAPEVNLIFAHFLLGLVATAQPQATPELQLAVLEKLAGLLLAPDEIHNALHGVPPGDGGFVARALRNAEQIGRRDGDAFLASLNTETTRMGAADHSQASPPTSAS